MGRRRECAELRSLLASARLVTLTGFGGVGKSRLAVRVAADARRSFPDGVWLVELAGLRDHSLLPHTVIGALNIFDRLAGDPTTILTTFLADRELLIVLDNCEHMIDACAVLVAEMLSAAPGVRVLATSREVLNVPGERTYAVAPLPVPEPRAATANAALESSAMALFAERAAAVSPGFAITADNASPVATVCQRLDGVPLAIELAAARLRALSVQQLAARLDDRFTLLTGNRGALPRHRNLWATVQWSYELCSETERVLWAQASVFADRFDLEAAERVCGGAGLPATEVLTALTSLVDKSVLIAEPSDGAVRYRLLDTVRQFGLYRLTNLDTTHSPHATHSLTESMLRQRHRDYYVDLAERFHTDWFGPRQATWADRMWAEFANLRTALEFCLTDPNPDAGLQLAGALYYFWYGCGETREGRHWLERFLAIETGPSRYRMRALAVYARLLILQGVATPALDPASESLELARQFDDPFWASHALQTLGLGTMYAGDLAAGQTLLREAVAHASRLGNTHPAVAFTTFALAVATSAADDPDRAGELYAQGQAIAREHGDHWWLGIVLIAAAVPALARGDLTQARVLAQESLRVRQGLRDKHGSASAVELLGLVAAGVHDYPRAARLLAAADRHWSTVGGSPFAIGQMRSVRDEYEPHIRHALGDAAFAIESRQGSELTLDEAVAYALGGDTTPKRPRMHSDAGPQLTPREDDVAALVAQGLTNRQIALRLVIAQRTAETHIANILTKLGFTSRTQLAVWYAGHHQDDQPPPPPDPEDT